ncbi:MAG: ferrochelatase [Gammaproteobacteria bacterium]|jgi:ferrochelatase|nr:ferrochelatase [Gammaproteobacteria bacterium]
MKSRYQGNSNYSHGHSAPIGILLTNLGTPEAPTPTALRTYLREFLSDPRVVEIPRPLWWLILNGFILPFRPKRSAKIYQKIWTPQGSPLLTHMQQLTAKLEQQLASILARPIKIALGMRYGNPSIAEGLAQLRQANARQILLLPLYPQYASATTGSSFDAISHILKTWRFVPETRFINHYADFAPYIEVLASRIRQHWQTHGQQNHLLFSFHGIPKRSQLAGDPYYCYCHKTARLVAEKLELTAENWSLVFQSRFGKAEWLQPYCDKTLAQLPNQGITEVDIICPGFAVDCLETLEEIDMQNRELFLAAGGKKFHYIPALNAQDDHIQVITQLIQQHLQGW